MILTVTFNAALDRLIFIDELQPGTRMVSHRVVDAVGGKGFDASVALRSLAIETLALGFVGGKIGEQLVSLLDGYGVAHDLIWLDGETRLAHVIAETKSNRHSHIIAGSLPISADAFSEFLRRYRHHAATAAWVVAAGSLGPGLPPNCYQTIVEIAHAAGTPILLDCTGAAARAAVAARPTILKMNEVEFCDTFGVEAETVEELQRQAQRVWARENLATLVITCGKAGILAVTDDGNVHRAAAPEQQAVNAAGAGDAASAALAWRRTMGDDWPNALRQAAAISAAAVLTEATGEVRPADVERLLSATHVQILGR